MPIIAKAKAHFISTDNSQWLEKLRVNNQDPLHTLLEAEERATKEFDVLRRQGQLQNTTRAEFVRKHRGNYIL